MATQRAAYSNVGSPLAQPEVNSFRLLKGRATFYRSSESENKIENLIGVQLAEPGSVDLWVQQAEPLPSVSLTDDL